MSVQITGMGAVTPLGSTVEDTWSGMLAGASGIGRLRGFDVEDFSVRIGGEVRGFDPASWLPAPDIRRLETFAQYGVAAAVQALDQADITPGSVDPERLGIVVGTGYGCTRTNAEAMRQLLERGPDRFGPTYAVYSSHDLVATYLAIRFGAQGESFAVSCACASGNVALGHAKRLIESGAADVVVAIGADGAIEPKDLAVTAGARALTTAFNDDPERASRPFDADRSGFVLSAGGGAVVLESAEHAAARGTEVLASLLGYGAATDAHHLTAPHPEGRGARAAMRKAIADAGLGASDLDYVNAHGTSTRLNDAVEAEAIRDVVAAPGQNLLVSSTKSMTGHMIGAAGVVETIACVQSVRDGRVPPTRNLDRPEFDYLDLVPHTSRAHAVTAAMSNSFGFGGHCTSVIVGAARD